MLRLKRRCIAARPSSIRYLYVDNWDSRRKLVMRYRVAGDGSLSDGKVFFDMTGAEGVHLDFGGGRPKEFKWRAVSRKHTERLRPTAGRLFRAIL